MLSFTQENRTSLIGGILSAAVVFSGPCWSAELTLIHMGDIHGHLVPRPASEQREIRGKTEGGLARMHTKIREIRSRRGASRVLLMNTGDTIQGSAEALFTRGQALVDVLNGFGIDAYAPGNWDWVYGSDRALELFSGPSPKAAWNALAANAYFDGEPYAARTGERPLPPFIIRTVDGIRVGLLGFTSDRGPQVVGRAVTRGLRFTKGDAEVREFVGYLREQARVDVVVMLSELGVANNIRLSEQTPGIDVILSSDMHEVTRQPFVTSTGTLVLEAGQDGQVLGELNLVVEGGKIIRKEWMLHPIMDDIREDARTAAKVSAVRSTFLSGRKFRPHVNPFNGTHLIRPIDTIVGRTDVALHRMGRTTAVTPAVLEGTSHGLLTDAFRAQAKADIGAIRGFRYGTVVRPGPIHLEDLYHFIPIGPMIARGAITGKQLKNQIEGAADGALNPNPAKWTGGWLFNFSGVRMTLDPYKEAGQRASDIEVFEAQGSTWKPLEPEREYTYASYYYARDPDLINGAPLKSISVVEDETGRPLDGVDVVVRYLQGLSGRSVSPDTGRIRLLKPLPGAVSRNPEIQPWRGARPLGGVGEVKADVSVLSPRPRPDVGNGPRASSLASRQPATARRGVIGEGLLAVAGKPRAQRIRREAPPRYSRLGRARLLSRTVDGPALARPRPGRSAAPRWVNRPGARASEGRRPASRISELRRASSLGERNSLAARASDDDRALGQAARRGIKLRPPRALEAAGGGGHPRRPAAYEDCASLWGPMQRCGASRPGLFQWVR